MKTALLLGAATATAMSLATMARADDQAVETVVVTGSRIASSDALSAAPISIVSSDAILKSKTVTLEQVLNKMPEIGQQGNNDQNSIAPGGFSTVDLRALGPARTLILINGQREVSTFADGEQAQDLSNIPVSMIDHIEVLRDGASPVYGADAIAGVINIITKKDFNGMEVTAGAGISTYGDHATKQLSALLGTTDSKGGILVGLEYYTEDPVRQSQRDWAHGDYAYSSAIPVGYYQGFTTGTKYCGGPGGSIIASPGGCGVFDTGEQPDLIQGREVVNANLTAHYDFNNDLSFFVESYFTNRKSSAQLNPEPIGTIYTSAKWANGLYIPATNPNNPTGEDLAIRKRLFEVGDRLFNDNVNTYQERAGFKGTLWGDWSWDAAFMHGESDGANYERNAINITHMHELVGDPAAPCEINAPAGCGSVTLAGTGSLTPAQVDYVRYTSQASSRYSQNVAYADLTGNLPVALQGGNVGVAVGVDWRREAVNNVPDAAKQSGDDAEGQDLPTIGDYDVKEAYGEVKIPLFKNVPFAEELSLDFAGRYSHYSNFGNAGVYKGAVNWAITDWLRFRGDYGTGYRAPQVGGELYLGSEQSANGFSDPCDTKNSAVTDPTIVANCAAVIPGYTGAQGTFLQNVPQVTATQSGNPNLKPETSNQFNLGLVFTPETWGLGNLSMTVDYYDIHINKVIGSIDVDTALTQCYDSSGFSSPYCAYIGPRQPPDYQLNAYSQIDLNLGYLHTDGVDMGLNYSTSDWSDSIGLPSESVLGFDAHATYMNNYIEKLLPGEPTEQFAGLWTTGAISTALPKWKANATVSLSLPNGFNVNWTERLVGATQTSYNPADTYVGLSCPAAHKYGYEHYDCAPALLFSDVSMSMPWDNYTATFGVDNVFDKSPPLIYDVYVQSISNQYDFAGRFFYLKLTAKY